jgi:hypothetical protein
MPHLTDEALAAALDPAGGGEAGSAARAHAARCATCATLLADARADDARIAAWLTALDHPVPAVDARAVLGRRRRAPAHRAAWWGVAAALVGVTAAAAAVVPPSTVRRVVEGVLHPARASRTAEPGVSGGTATTAQASAPAGVEIVPTGVVVIRFAADQHAGVVRVMPGDGPALRVEAIGGRATYAVGRDQITVTNRAIDSTEYRVMLPAASRARIMVMEHTIYDGAAPAAEVVLPLR